MTLNVEHLTNCECSAPGYCARHRCEKNRFRFEMCRRSIGWFDAWERGRGPGQQSSIQPPPQNRANCRHLQQENRLELCPTCRGTVHIKVFACAVHGECTTIAILPAIIGCDKCNDYEDL